MDKKSLVKALSQKEQEEIREKERVYQDCAQYLTAKVPVEELSNLIEWMVKLRDSFEQKVTFHEPFDAFPQDGAVAFNKALMDKFGFVDHKGAMGFWGPRLPELMSVTVGPGNTIKVPWGKFALPGYEGLELTVGTHAVKDTIHFCISGVVKKKDQAVIQDLTERIRENLMNHSIYKGKAISLRFDEDFDPESYSPDDVAPEFLDLTRIDQNELVLPEVVMRMVEDNLFTPVEKTDLCRKFNVPLRRGVLLAGTYGVGKTLTAQIQALKATRNGWTFIYLKNVDDLAEGLRVARQYSPAVVFAEDIDRVMEGDNRTDDMNEILNTIDGIELKGKEVLVVLTTNHAEKINPAMIRPGRIDALIEMTAPDAKAAEKLLTIYGRGLVDPKADLTKVGKVLDGSRPAMIAETVQRSKLSAITRMAVNETELVVGADDLEAAAKGMQHHMRLVDGGAGKKELTPAEKVGKGILEVFQTAREEHTGKNGKQAKA